MPHKQTASAYPKFSKTLLPHVDLLSRLALRLTKSQADAQDLLQETMLRALVVHDQWERIENHKAWLCRIMRNTYFNLFQREKLFHRYLQSETNQTQDEVAPPAETVALEREQNEQIQIALAALSESYRQVLVLSQVEDLSYEEVAETVGCPIGTVMSRLHRGRKEFAKSFRSRLQS